MHNNVFDAEVTVDLFVNECFIGAGGTLMHDYISIYWKNDMFDCNRRRYRPALPVLKKSFFNDWDFSTMLMPWQCSYTELGPPSARFADEIAAANTGGDESSIPDEPEEGVPSRPDFGESKDFDKDEEEGFDIAPSNPVSMM